MGTNECSQTASKSSWDSQDLGDVNMVLEMAHFRKSIGPQWFKSTDTGTIHFGWKSGFSMFARKCQRGIY